MRWMPTAMLSLLLPTAPVLAQTDEIQQEIERKLWFQRILERITSVPPVYFFTLLVFMLALGAAFWLWKSRRKPAD